MRVKDIYPSAYLNADDVDPPVIYTIKSHTFEELGPEKKARFIIFVEETDKKFAVNITNLRTIEMVLGTDETGSWIGKPIELYKDFVQFGSEVVPAIRVRRPKESPLAV